MAGFIAENNGQDVVRCSACNRYQYNAPRVETGRKVRTLASREGVPVGQRSRILDAHDHCCIACGRRPPDIRLELDHIIPRDVAAKFDILDDLIDSPANLAPLCAECNSGRRLTDGPSVRLMYRCLLIQAKRQTAA